MRVRKVNCEEDCDFIRIREINEMASPGELHRLGRQLTQNIRTSLYIGGMLLASVTGIKLALNPPANSQAIVDRTATTKDYPHLRALEEAVKLAEAKEAQKLNASTMPAKSSQVTHVGNAGYDYPPSYQIHQLPEWAFKLGVDAATIARTEYLYDQAVTSDLVQKNAPESAQRLELLVALAIKESALDSRAVSTTGAVGLMQLMQPALADLKKQRGVKLSANQVTDHLQNAIGGMIYFDILMDYARHYFPGEQNEKNLEKIALLSYNAGIGFLSNHRRPGDTYETFITRVAQKFNREIGGGVPQAFAEINSTYGVPMRVLPGVKRYIDLRSRNLVPQKSVSGASLKVIGDGLVYAELIHSLAQNLHTPPPEWLAGIEVVTITDERRFWTVANDILSHLAGRLPNYSDFNHRNYARRMYQREMVIDVIIEFNNQFNFGFRNLGIKKSPTADIPNGTKLIIPSLATFQIELTLRREVYDKSSRINHKKTT